MKIKLYMTKRIFIFGKITAKAELEADTLEEFKELAKIFGAMELKVG